MVRATHKNADDDDGDEVSDDDEDVAPVQLRLYHGDRLSSRARLVHTQHVHESLTQHLHESLKKQHLHGSLTTSGYANVS